ncbi:hypothetical protein [Streptomyces sp. NBC_00059]|uniref:hypothetical protein n=1 Tax=Streptomyces sp. NBC_00059 TaxID=2975635 RepID=UPI0022586E7A|nr:hypothetical protein [Streptomyces sp. NBC_00059]MCX5415627.1 hypothetical protein [Streptomyces sp. NBC_00059]
MKSIRATGAVAAMMLAAALSSAPNAQAAAGDCIGSLAASEWGTKGHVMLFRESNGWCAMAYHSQAYWGVYLPTAVQMVRIDGAVSEQDHGNYRYYAGPVRWAFAPNGLVYASAWISDEHLVTGIAYP